ncbi:hypothetical protein BDK51DRAFT_48327 [Blyttiomyces helicus]|uniref:Uncharacterized protein n=1 Tax=Blyttiomyces helicus TaxID=388810 RepID=A0A4P9WI37_9FUNG|nr:hypothetical protein BDK51DRAFT_48327 [Blyttiomyces helicus]|eukprot:RKO92511.1 hypothetical protein BDK51DRAFT_48327 [Blyttiomyces helicus]
MQQQKRCGIDEPAHLLALVQQTEPIAFPTSSPSASTSTRNLLSSSPPAASLLLLINTDDSVFMLAPLLNANETVRLTCPALNLDVLRLTMKEVGRNSQRKKTLLAAALFSCVLAVAAVTVLWQDQRLEKVTSARRPSESHLGPGYSFDRFVHSARKAAHGRTTYGELVRQLLILHLPDRSKLDFHVDLEAISSAFSCPQLRAIEVRWGPSVAGTRTWRFAEERAFSDEEDVRQIRREVAKLEWLHVSPQLLGSGGGSEVPSRFFLAQAQRSTTGYVQRNDLGGRPPPSPPPKAREPLQTRPLQANHILLANQRLTPSSSHSSPSAQMLSRSQATIVTARLCSLATSDTINI